MTDPSVSLRLTRDPQAPGRARAAVIDGFRERLGAAAVYDVALVVSELVTNSVTHPGAASERELGVEVGLVGDHVLIAVSDRGAQIVPRGLHRESGERFGLELVDRLAGSWGVARDGVGRTQVWCELPLDRRYG
jgi:anti-sigma regulatory factor (Ser/Thr protein kinase)